MRFPGAIVVEHQGPVSNEAEFEYWLASAFESERERLRNPVAAPDSHPKPAADRTAAGEKKKKGDEAAA
jgi:hypothetical protein